jgi:MFS family permease
MPVSQPYNDEQRAARSDAALHDGHSEVLRDSAGAAAARPVIRRGAFYALSFRNFRLFFVGQLISVAGTWMQAVAQQWLVFRLTHSPAWLGIVSGASAIPYVVFSMWGGQVVDRHERRTILVWTQTVMMLFAFVLAALATDRWIPVQAWHVAALAALGGIVNAFNMPAQQAFVVEMVDDPKALGNAIALNSLRFNLARFLGPIFAGAVLVKVGMAACFFLNGVSFLAVIASLMMMRLPPFQPQERRLSAWGGFVYIRQNRAVFRVITLVGTGSLFAWSASTLYPVFAAHFHRGAGGFSTIMAINGVGAALGGLSVAVLGDRMQRRLLVYGGAMLFGSALMALTFAPGFHAALACLALSGFAMIMFGINANTMVQEGVPDALRGRVMAIYSLVFAALMPVGGLQIGFLAQRVGAMNAVRLNASLCLLVAIAFYIWSEADRRARRRM